MAILKPLVRALGRLRQLTALDTLSVPGPMQVDGDVTTGGDITSTNRTHRARHIYLGPMGGPHIVDMTGGPDPVEIFRIMADAQPATAIVFTVTGGDALTIGLNDLSVAIAGALSAAGVTSAGDVLAIGASVGRFYGQRTGGLGNCATFGGKGPTGAVMGSISVSASGLINVDNPSALAVAFAISSGWARAAGFGQASETNLGTVTSAAAVNWTSNSCNRFTLTAGSPCAVSFTAPPTVVAGLTLKVVHPASGTVPAITWPSAVRWAAGTKPAPSIAGRTTVFTFYFDGTNYWGSAILDAA